MMQAGDTMYQPNTTTKPRNTHPILHNDYTVYQKIGFLAALLGHLAGVCYIQYEKAHPQAPVAQVETQRTGISISDVVNQK